MARAFDRDFWRGVVDGDGTVGIWRERGTLRPVVTLAVASRVLVVQFAAFAGAALGGRPPAVCARRNAFRGAWVATVRGVTAARLVRVLYGAGGVSLPRKQITADAIMAGGENTPAAD